MSTPTGTPEIPEEVRRFLTDAKRHHYVAEFHQRRFSSAPAEEHPQIHRLDVRTGKTSSHVHHQQLRYPAPQHLLRSPRSSARVC